MAKGAQFERDVCRQQGKGKGRGYKGATEDRFWRKVVGRDDPDGCWEFGASRGYGFFWFSGKMVTAHRFSMMLLLKESLPNTTQVLHKCDNPRCVNPKHLFLGSHQDNMDDKVFKGRTSKGDKHSEIMRRVGARGEKVGTSKLTERDVRAIRKAHREGSNTVELGKRFGVHNSVISRIVRRVVWRHI